MVIWGLVLIAIGVGALFDVSIWPVILIAVGVSALLSVAFRRNPEMSGLFNCWQCWPGSNRSEPQETTTRRQE